MLVFSCVYADRVRILSGDRHGLFSSMAAFERLVNGGWVVFFGWVWFVFERTAESYFQALADRSFQ